MCNLMRAKGSQDVIGGVGPDGSTLSADCIRMEDGHLVAAKARRNQS
jgi:hypothetical protein